MPGKNQHSYRTQTDGWRDQCRDMKTKDFCHYRNDDDYDEDDDQQ